MKYDLTKGPVFKTISLFALPMLLGNILQQMYNIVDTWVVGRYVSSQALAAVGAAFALMTFLTSVIIGLCMGSSVIISLCFGKKDWELLSRTIGTSFLLIGGMTVVMTILPICGMNVIVRWMNIPDEIQAMISGYLYLVFGGIPAVFLYNFFASYLKAVGNSFVPLFFLGISAGLNIGLDLWFVAGCSMGVTGAAMATVIAQYLSGIGIGIYVLSKNVSVRKALRRIRLKREDVALIAKYSVFTCLQQSVMNLGILMVQGIVNSFGTVVMAAFAAGVKIDAFAYMPAQEYANAFSTFIAQNTGAGNHQRTRKGMLCGAVTSMTYCAAASVVLWVLAEKLMKIFVDPSEQEILAVGVSYLHIEGMFYCGIGCLFLLYGLYRAIGQPAMSLVLTIISLGSRVVIAEFSAKTGIGVTGIWWAVPIGWGLADLTGILYYIKKYIIGKKQSQFVGD